LQDEPITRSRLLDVANAAVYIGRTQSRLCAE